MTIDNVVVSFRPADQATRAVDCSEAKDHGVSVSRPRGLRHNPLSSHESADRSRSPPRGVPLRVFTPIADLDNNVGRALGRVSHPAHSRWANRRELNDAAMPDR